LENIKYGDKRNKQEDEEKEADNELTSTAFHHEDGDHWVEHCDNHEDECLEVIVSLVWHLDG
jgi:SOS response regulatory protein OraA/RecX